jgi:hypothetical protein
MWVALLVLVLSVMYSLMFGYMVYVSLLEEVFAVNPDPPRYAIPTHFHNSIEWMLIATPALIGLGGTAGSIAYLLRRRRRFLRAFQR